MLKFYSDILIGERIQESTVITRPSGLELGHLGQFLLGMCRCHLRTPTLL